MTKFKKTLTIIISALVISILNLSISAYAIESFSNPNDGLENCHQLDQYEVNDNYILHDANDHNAFSSRAVLQCSKTLTGITTPQSTMLSCQCCFLSAGSYPMTMSERAVQDS